MTSRVPDEWTSLFSTVPATVFAALGASEEWDDVLAQLTEAFAATRQAFREGRPVVYVVRNDDLLGRRGAGMAMVATGLVSGARTAALEGRKDGLTVNVIAVDDGMAPEAIARWAGLLSAGDRPTGELVHLGAGHVGKALS